MLCPHCKGALFTSRPPRLSPRRLEILLLLSGGLEHPDVAKKLHMGLNTVYDHTKAIRRYFGVRTTFEAVAKARLWDVI
jgi:DNA-binding CsgD family transcriptional regulator